MAISSVKVISAMLKNTRPKHASNATFISRARSSANSTLASVELAEERARLMKVALLACFGLVFFSMALMTFTLLIAILFWETYRWQAIGAIVRCDRHAHTGVSGDGHPADRVTISSHSTRGVAPTG